mgnify:CR=1 FL=1|tara:strand:- start:42 stop:566 length:525 start_codon:yes stop_codon:yes gene_type:complete
MAQNVDLRISLTGFKKLEKRFNRLAGKIQVNALRRAVRKGNAIFRKAGKQNAPVGNSKRLRKSIKSKLSKKFHTITGTTGVDAGRGSKNDAWYANFVEFGTKTRVSTKRIFQPVNLPGWLRTDKFKDVPAVSLKSFPATRFMKKTFESNKDRAIREFRNEIRRTVIASFRGTLK